jgi:hypothetical protein
MIWYWQWPSRRGWVSVPSSASGCGCNPSRLDGSRWQQRVRKTTMPLRERVKSWFETSFSDLSATRTACSSKGVLLGTAGGLPTGAVGIMPSRSEGCRCLPGNRSRAGATSVKRGAEARAEAGADRILVPDTSDLRAADRLALCGTSSVGEISEGLATEREFVSGLPAHQRGR